MLTDQVPRMHAAAAEHWLPSIRLTVGGSPVGDGEFFQQNLQQAQQKYMVWRTVQTFVFDMKKTATKRCIEANLLHRAYVLEVSSQRRDCQNSRPGTGTS